MKSVSTKTYIITFFFTLCVFFAALFISNYINNRKTQELQSDEEKISVDILSLETQLDVLKDASCSSIATSSLRSELDSLNGRLTYMEQQVGTDNQDVFRLERYYALLEVRDYLLQKQAAADCHNNAILILYFYSTKNCPDCSTEQYILQAVQDEYPQIRVYSFDYNLDLPAVQTLISLHNIPKNPPIIDINGKVYARFPSLSDLQAVLQPLVATSTATSTKSSALKK